MSWQKNNIGLNEAFDRYCADQNNLFCENYITLTGTNGASIHANDLINIQFSMSEMGKRVAEMEESLRRVQMALEAHDKREEPSFAPLYQFAQKVEEKKAFWE